MNNSLLINADSHNFEYYTPSFIVEAARETMRSIDLDPASSKAANKIVGADKIFTINDNGLQQEWHGHVWMNHPFGKKTNKLWIDKLINEYKIGNTIQACCITFASTSEKWFQPLLMLPQCFLSPRTNFLDANGAVKKGVTKGSVVTYFGNDIDSFYKNFQQLGQVKLNVQQILSPK